MVLKCSISLNLKPANHIELVLKNGEGQSTRIKAFNAPYKRSISNKSFKGRSQNIN